MIVRDFAMTVTGEARTCSATVAWEDHDYPEQALFFEIRDGDEEHRIDEPSADAFLTGCFPLAAVHGEARVRIEARPCPMLIEGLQTALAWWRNWGEMPGSAPTIETLSRGRSQNFAGPRRAFSCL